MIRRHGALFLAVDSAPDYRDYMRWRIALALGDSSSLHQTRQRFPLMSSADLYRILGVMQLDGVGLEDADLVLDALRGNAVTPAERDEVNFEHRNLALNQGKFDKALALAGSWQAPGPGFHNGIIRDALCGDGDSAGAARAVATLAPWVDRAIADGTIERRGRHWDVFMVSLWRAQHGELRTIPQAIARLHAPGLPRPGLGGEPPGGPDDVAVAVPFATAILEAMLAAAERPDDLESLLDRVDSLEQTILYPWNPLTLFDPILARMRERTGDRAEALRILQARAYLSYGSGIGYLATSLREEGRLAAALGDRESAIRAYRHYLALRMDPDARIKPEVDGVRAELSRLVTSAHQSGSAKAGKH